MAHRDLASQQHINWGNRKTVVDPILRLLISMPNWAICGNWRAEPLWNGDWNPHVFAFILRTYEAIRPLSTDEKRLLSPVVLVSERFLPGSIRVN